MMTTIEAMKLAATELESQIKGGRRTLGLHEVAATLRAAVKNEEAPPNCGTGHCSCIECFMTPASGELAAAAKLALEAIIELQYSNSTLVAYAKCEQAKKALKEVLK